MAASNTNFGDDMENWIEHICRSTFLADFTIRTPKYQKKNGQTKEAADLLIVFKDTLLIIQVKTRLVSDMSDALNQVDINRIKNSVDKAMKQFRAMLEAVNDPNFFTFTNVRGRPIKVERENIKNVVTLVVYGLITPSGQIFTTKLRFVPSCFMEADIPLHLFSSGPIPRSLPRSFFFESGLLRLSEQRNPLLVSSMPRSLYPFSDRPGAARGKNRESNWRSSGGGDRQKD